MSFDVRKYFSDEDDSSPSFLRMVKTILILVGLGVIALIVLVSGVFGAETRDSASFAALSLSLVFDAIALYFVYQGKPAMAKAVVPLSLVVAVAAIALSNNGLRDTSIVGLPLILIISALLLGRRAMWIAAPLTLAALALIAIEDIRLPQPVEESNWSNAAVIAVMLSFGAAIIQILVNRLHESIRKARENERLLQIENKELEDLRSTLEERIQRRTAELETANRAYERQARQFVAISQVTRVITAIQDLDTLLPYITQVISEHFNVYHVGIFMLDATGEYAVLRAANSDGGRRMLARGHKLPVGRTGIVGFVAATSQPRIALDVGADAVYFDNPDMPETRSEIALPLRYAGKLLGVLDAQSVESNAFMQDDIQALTTLADQVAAIINNVMTAEESRKQMEKYRRTVEESAREYWKVMRPRTLGLGMRFKDATVEPLQKPLEGEHIQDALAQNKVILHAPKRAPSTIAAPLRLRGKIIGVLSLTARGAQKFTRDDADIVEAVTERLSLALETANLLQAAQHRADVERATADAASRVGSSAQFEIILQTAAREISRALGGSEVTVQIEPLSLELGLNE